MDNFGWLALEYGLVRELVQDSEVESPNNLGPNVSHVADLFNCPLISFKLLVDLLETQNISLGCMLLHSELVELLYFAMKLSDVMVGSSESLLFPLQERVQELNKALMVLKPLSDPLFYLQDV